MNKKVWALVMVAALVLCPVALMSVSNEASSDVRGNEPVFDPEGGGDVSPDGVEGNDPEHPQ